MTGKRVDYSVHVGKTFTRLTVLSIFRKPGPNRSRVFFRCLCACGKEVDAVYGDVLRGKHRSCGCLHIDTITRHGHSSYNPANTSPTYKSWLSMKQRCTNPKSTHAHRYIGRGIGLCERWNLFGNFLADMGERPSLNHSIDRIDNSLGYEPSNCRWATKKEQAANRTYNVRWQHRKRDKLGRWS